MNDYKSELKYVAQADETGIESGWFAQANSTENRTIFYGYPWYHCRESFARHVLVEGCTEYLFAHADDYGSRIAAFISKVEDKLGLKRNRTTIVGFKNRADRSLIQIAPWWTRNEMRRQLFTILLRCGRMYGVSTDNFDEALYSSKYIQETQEAVEKFFKGYTLFDGQMSWVHGWYYCFRPGAIVVNLPLMKKPVLKPLAKKRNPCLQLPTHGQLRAYTNRLYRR